MNAQLTNFVWFASIPALVGPALVGPALVGLALVGLAVAAPGCSTSSEVSRSIGARCDNHGDCDEICLSGDDYPDGFCSRSCDDSGDCRGNAVCVAVDQGICLFTCNQAADCEFLGPGWTCGSESRQPRDVEVMVCTGD